jgi:TPR repeat protein
MRRRAFGSLAALFAAALLLCAWAAPAAAEGRVALVIGNGAYRHIRALANPPHDGADVAAALRHHGFDVLSGLDLDRAGMMRLMDRFVTAASHADVAMFYYAGHGFEIGHRNYLIPVDATLKSVAEIASEAIAVQPFLQRLAALPALKLVFLDACRNDPAPGMDSGFDRQEPPGVDFDIVFSTQPGKTAYDGGGRNSPFAQAFLSHLGSKGQPLPDMMVAVRKDVLAATGTQVPVEFSSVTRSPPFSFQPGSSVTLTAEAQLWQVAGGTRDPDLLRIYVDRYHDGPHANDARSLLSAGSTVTLSSGANRPAASAAAIDDDLWELAQSTQERSLVAIYLSRYPNGRHAAEARALDAKLARAAGDMTSAVACNRLATHPNDATASNPGVPFDVLKSNAEDAIKACRKAVAQNPKAPHYTALLARAMSAGNHWDEAIALYRRAAAGGDLRAMWSLAVLLEAGEHVRKDVKAALALYEKAAAAGSTDAAINLAADLEQGVGGRRDMRRALALLRQAAEEGSALAAYDLGASAVQGVGGKPADAAAYFRRAIDLGEPRGYLAVALLFDSGTGVKHDPTEAAAFLLKGVALDYGEALAAVAGHQYTSWSPATLAALQSQLKRLGFYRGRVDGRNSARLVDALKQYRLRGDLGPLASIGGRP